jgi:hypothetical protein
MALALLINSNIRRERPGKDKCPSLFALLVKTKEKSFITFTTGVNVIKRLYFVTDEKDNKLERLFLSSLIFAGNARSLT